jgi:soluble lytic murein transglycosylase-like protein
MYHEGGKYEGQFDKNAISTTGKHFGLMQVSQELLDDSNVKNWNNVALNTMVGTKYLAYLLKYFDGDMEKAIAGYNCGEGRVKKLVNKYGGNWKKYLPKETKKYLPKVLSLYKKMS